jgi:hypothetical protein
MATLYTAGILLIPSIVLIVWAIKQERRRNHQRTDGKGEA